MQCSAVLYSAVHYVKCGMQFNSMHCRAVKFSVQCYAVQCSAVQFSAVLCSTVQGCAVQCSAVQYSALLCSTVHCCAIQFSAVQYVRSISWEPSLPYSKRLALQSLNYFGSVKIFIVFTRAFWAEKNKAPLIRCHRFRLEPWTIRSPH